MTVTDVPRGHRVDGPSRVPLKNRGHVDDSLRRQTIRRAAAVSGRWV